MKNKDSYLQEAADWYYERYEEKTISANRFFLAFLVSMTLCVLLVISFVMVLPLKTWIPFIIHQNTTTGEVWVERPNSNNFPRNDAEVKADIVRYITTRESYTAADINERFKLVMLLSQSNIGKVYADEQSNSNKSSPVNLLSTEGIRTVHIEDIVFIENESNDNLRHFNVHKENLAKVDFTVMTIKDGSNTTIPYVATIGWKYLGTPKDEAAAWDNWNGFNVTTYRVDERVVNN